MAQSDVKKFLPARLREARGKNIQGLIKSFNEKNEFLESLISACIDQLFLQTASGRYLVQLGEQSGFIMPPNSGLDIRSYSVLMPIMISGPKQVRKSFENLVEAFYSSNKTRPTIIAAAAKPYSLNDGDDLIIETESGTFNFVITTGKVADLTSVTATELAAVINAEQSQILADEYLDRSANQLYLRLQTSNPGVGSFIRVAGGTLQNVLRFPNLIGTKNATGTTWNITKTSLFSDVVKFTWDGLGTNPNIFLTKKDDVVTIRGLVDGSSPFSLLNGSYKVVDSGYDYFTIHNEAFFVISSTITQSSDTNIVFTSQNKLSLYDNGEFAVVSESENSVTLSVPAVPPLARRFLQGSSHLHGFINPVLDFTRNSIKISIPTGTEKPSSVNQFILRSKTFRADFRHKFYATTGADDAINPTYSVDTAANAVLPYTSPAPLGTDPIFGSVGDSSLTINFPFSHGFDSYWGITLSSATGAANITAPDLNKEHQVIKIIGENKLQIVVKDTNGNPKPFAGIPFSPFDVYQHSTQQANGSDFYLQFANQAAATAAGIITGTRLKIDPSSGADLNLYYANLIKTRLIEAVEIRGDKIDIFAGFGPGGAGEVISAASGHRSGYFGGPASHFFDKTSAINMEKVMSGLEAVFVDYTKSSNPDYVGSYIFDPSGKKTKFTVSKYIVTLNQTILRGGSTSSLEVSSSTASDGSAFPSSGQIILGYGTDNEEGPVSYYAVVTNPSSVQIVIDPSYRFQKNHAPGASIQKIYSSVPYKPGMTGKDYPVYVTGTNNARDTLFALADLLAATGVFIEKDLLLPTLRYEDPAISVFS